jgi:hypothetical protein
MALLITGYSPDAIPHQWPVDTGIEMLHKPLTRDVLEDKIRTILIRSRAPGLYSRETLPVAPTG